MSSGVPPPLPLPVLVDVLELEVGLFECDVLVEASKVDSGATVTPTTAMLVVVDSGPMVVATIVVVEDVAAAWGVDELVELVLVLVLVVDALPSMPADWTGTPLCPPPCPYPFPLLLEDGLPSAFEQSVRVPFPARKIPIRVFGYALVPTQVVVKRFVRLSRKPMHFAEHPCPEKSALEQSERGVL